MGFSFGATRTFWNCAALAGALALILSEPAHAADTRVSSQPQIAVLAGGCFWGMEDVFENLNGVLSVVAGYSGGTAMTASYDIVSTGTTGHAESVEITYDPSRISYETLLKVYFRVAHDPTQRDRQGPDDGSQYRSAVFYANDAQQRGALAEVASLSRVKAFRNPIVTEIAPLKAFYPAESYHQHFADRNPTYPYIVAIDAPKLIALKATYPQLMKHTK